eukprot:19566_1
MGACCSKKRNPAYCDTTSKNAMEIIVASTYNYRNNHCDSIDKCQHAEKLVCTMIQYNEFINHMKEKHLNKMNERIVAILNDFNHMLLNHNQHDHFLTVYNSLGEPCVAEKCQFILTRMKRHKNIAPVRKRITQQLLDTIHCHFYHSYDGGYRLKNNMHHTRKIDHKYYIDNTIVQLHKQIKYERKKFYKSVNIASNAVIHSKFNSFLCDSSNSVQGTNMHEYSHGYKLMYWNYHKKNVKRFYYVPAKYNDLKQELISNRVANITLNQFDDEYKKAVIYKQCNYTKSIKANIDKYLKFGRNSGNHPRYYALDDTSVLNETHLLCIIIYCAYDEFQNEFSATFRKQNTNESIHHLIQRNSKFHFFAKYLHEIINGFGEQMIDGKIKSFYHGVNQNMLFQNTNAFMHGPLSTTSFLEVAINFTNNNGLVLELYPNYYLKYFSCSFFSKYSSEQEYLFIGGIQPMTFINILNTRFGWQFQKYIKAISVLDTMTSGILFNDNKNIYDKLLKVNHWNPLLVGATELDANCRDILIQLVKNELKIELYSNVPQYIERLFHHICVNKLCANISWETMNINISKKFKLGYIGYLFMRSMFCLPKQQCVNLCFINALYPNLQLLYLADLLFTDEEMLNHILRFVNNNKSTIKHIYLYLQKGVSKYNSVYELVMKYKTQFAFSGANINCHKDMIYKIHGVIIK